MPWFVLYTKSRSEKTVADKLTAMDIEVYCPLIKTKRKWSDRLKSVEEPLFRSYCFVRLEEHERHKVFTIPGVVRYLFWQKKPAIVRDIEIDAIKMMLNQVDHHLLTVRTFQPGDRLRIASGTFTDTTGQVIRKQGKAITVMIDALQLILTVDLSKTVVVV